MPKEFKHIEFDENKLELRVIDQRRLPTRTVWFTIKDAETAYIAIRSMIVRGAPLIGVVGAFGLAFEIIKRNVSDANEAKRIASYLSSARPTAINLSYAVNRVLKSFLKEGSQASTLNEAVKIMREEEESSYKIGMYGAELLEDGDTILTHCNAGALATVKYGTALAPIRVAIEKGLRVKVIATETRPVLQGARLTTYELIKDNIDVTLISDTMVGYVMYKGLVSKVIVGADRVLESGHVFNKIGTYQIAILAKKHGIPFYVALPFSTFDFESKLRDVKIEERDPSEVLYVRGKRIAPRKVKVLNPAFDVTPPEYVAALITDLGIVRPPYDINLRKLKGEIKKRVISRH